MKRIISVVLLITVISSCKKEELVEDYFVGKWRSIVSETMDSLDYEYVFNECGYGERHVYTDDSTVIVNNYGKDFFQWSIDKDRKKLYVDYIYNNCDEYAYGFSATYDTLILYISSSRRITLRRE